MQFIDFIYESSNAYALPLDRIFIWLFVLAIAFCALTDIFKSKIYNFITFSLMILGIIANIQSHGFARGLFISLSGIVVGLIIYIPFYMFKIMGAGDVKLLMAIGSLGGAEFAINNGVISIIVGGLLSLFILILSGRIVATLREIFYFFRSIILRELKMQLPKFDMKLKAPFGVAMAIAFILVTLFNYKFL